MILKRDRFKIDKALEMIFLNPMARGIQEI